MNMANLVKLLDQISANRQAKWVFSGMGSKNSGWSHEGLTVDSGTEKQ
jgi:hypothetical protein